jgi:demethylmenaquinone methyltransferase/2-methoxy-6-polyprenyl-1,4-benzoquinol methylase
MALVEGTSRRSALPDLQQKREMVQAMFDRIAPRYDAMNRVISLGLDRRWRALALDAVGVASGDVVIDLACGTGDLSELAAARGARVVAVDFAREMLRGAQTRLPTLPLVQGDGAALPFATGSASVLTCGFALRNFVSLPDVLREMARVLAPDGRLALIEVDRPSSGFVRAGHSLYFDRVVPRLGAWFSDRDAYAYLPQSTSYLPEAPAMRMALRDAGFDGIAKRRLLLGSAQILTAVRS